MNKYLAGYISGFTATLLVSLFMYLKSHLGYISSINMVREINQFFGEQDPYLGWFVHFLSGTFVWGGLFVFLRPALVGDSNVLKGLNFGIIAWFLIMVVFMPLAGKGLFASAHGMSAVSASLFLHMLYGLILGLMYGLLTRK